MSAPGLGAFRQPSGSPERKDPSVCNEWVGFLFQGAACMPRGERDEVEAGA